MFSIYIPTEFIFGSGALKQLSQLKLPGKKALIVTSKGKSIIKNGALGLLQEQLEKQEIGYTVFNEIEANPEKTTIMRGAEVARENSCDFVIGLGGGSPMDASKAIALMATNSGDLWDYCMRGTGKKLQPANKALPIVCITTTAGTGSEADASGMINNVQTNEKFGISGPSLFPTLSVIDPELMVSVPPLYSAYQGLDALFHLTEAYLSTKANFFNEMCAITGVEHIGKYLVRSIKNGNDLEAREHMAFANTMGGFVMSTGKLMSQHSLEHTLSAFHPDLPHGAGLVLICRAYFGLFIKKGVRKEKFIRLARALGKQDTSQPEDFLTALDGLIKECGLDHIRMADWNIKEEELARIACETYKNFNDLFYNDPVLLTEEECVQIYQESFNR